MEDYVNSELERYFLDVKNSIISFFPDDFIYKVIMVIAALVIVYGISCLFEKDEKEHLS